MALGLKADSLKRAKKFIDEILETNVVYCLVEEDGVLMSTSHDFHDDEGNPAPLVPFWSKSFIPYARKWGEGAEVDELSLETFVKGSLRNMNEDGIIVGVNWNQKGFGYECEAYSILENLAKAEDGEEVIL